jgi:hypothetical protein
VEVPKGNANPVKKRKWGREIESRMSVIPPGERPLARQGALAKAAETKYEDVPDKTPRNSHIAIPRFASCAHDELIAPERGHGWGVPQQASKE